jgi:hypothetical protein
MVQMADYGGNIDFEGETEDLNSEASKRKVKIAKKITSIVKWERMN